MTHDELKLLHNLESHVFLIACFTPLENADTNAASNEARFRVKAHRVRPVFTPAIWPLR